MAKIAPYVFSQELDDNGDPLASGKLYTYEAGTTTPKVTYTDAGESASNTNPIILDADGRASIWLDSGSYRMVLHDSNDVLIRDVDDITGGASNVFGSSVVSVSTNTNITSSYQNNIIDCTSAITLSLLDVATAEEGFLFSVKNSSSGDVTIDPDASELIDDASTLTLYPNQSALIVCTGSGWLANFQDVVGLSLSNQFTGTNQFAGTTNLNGKFVTPHKSELTISSGSITPNGVFHTVDTESDAASDDLDTIASGVDGQRFLFVPANASRTVIITSSGNIVTASGENVILDDVTKPAYFIYSGDQSKWVLINQPDIYSDVVIKQYASSESTSYSNLTTTLPYDNTIPQNTEGTEILSLAFTPRAATSTLVIKALIPYDIATAVVGCAALFVDSTAGALAGSFSSPNGGGGGDMLEVTYEVSAASTTARTYKIRAGAGTAGNFFLNGSSSNRIFGGISKAVLQITEVK